MSQHFGLLKSDRLLELVPNSLRSEPVKRGCLEFEVGHFFVKITKGDLGLGGLTLPVLFRFTPNFDTRCRITMAIRQWVAF